MSASASYTYICCSEISTRIYFDPLYAKAGACPWLTAEGWSPLTISITMEPDIAVTVGITVGTETEILMGVYVGFGTFAYAQTISCEVAGVAVPKIAALTGEVIIAKATSPPP